MLKRMEDMNPNKRKKTENASRRKHGTTPPQRGSASKKQATMESFFKPRKVSSAAITADTFCKN